MIARVYAPLGMLGYGFPEASLQAAIEKRPDVFAVDAGSVDAGPYYLGTGSSFTSDVMVHRDLSLLLPAALKLGAPLVIGSAGGGGARPHLDRTTALVRRIADERGLSFRMAAIPGDIRPEVVERAIERGHVVDFEAGRELTPDDVASCSHLVGQMGVEPLIAALEGGAQVVVAGRAYDAAAPAALAVLGGADRGLALHMGKITECGAAIASPRASDGVIADVHADCFDLEPADPAKLCSVDLVAAHTLYEKSDPYILHLPGGHLDLRDVVFEQVNPRRVRVRGSRFVEAQHHMIKLEGAAHVGCRAICVAGARDPVLIEHLDSVIDRVRAKVASDLGQHIAPSDYSLRFRIYGRDGVMASLEPERRAVGHEVGVLIDVVASTQATADAVAALARSAMLHAGYPGRKATGGNLAFPYSPAEFAAPPVYEFRVYHLLRTDDPSELFPIVWEDVNSDS